MAELRRWLRDTCDGYTLVVVEHEPVLAPGPRSAGALADLVRRTVELDERR